MELRLERFKRSHLIMRHILIKNRPIISDFWPFISDSIVTLFPPNHPMIRHPWAGRIALASHRELTKQASQKTAIFAMNVQIDIFLLLLAINILFVNPPKKIPNE